MTDQEIFFSDGPTDPSLQRTPFARWFNGMLKARHLSRQEFADRIGVDRAYVAHWALDRTPNPDSCLKIAQGLGLPKADVLIAAGYIDRTNHVDDRNPTRARLHALIDTLPPEMLEPHLALLEQSAAVLGMAND